MCRRESSKIPLETLGGAARLPFSVHIVPNWDAQRPSARPCGKPFDLPAIHSFILRRYNGVIGGYRAKRNGIDHYSFPAGHRCHLQRYWQGANNTSLSRNSHSRSIQCGLCGKSGTNYWPFPGCK